MANSDRRGCAGKEMMAFSSATEISRLPHQPKASRNLRRRMERLKPMENPRDQSAASLVAQMAKDGSFETDRDLIDDLQLQIGHCLDLAENKVANETYALWALDNGLKVFDGRVRGQLLTRMLGSLHRYLVSKGYQTAAKQISTVGSCSCCGSMKEKQSRAKAST